MTNQYFNITINSLYLCQEDIKNEAKNNLRDGAELDKHFTQHNEYYFGAHRKGIHMKKRDIKLEDAVKYMKWLFDKTGQKYSCTRIKLAKLLAIVALKYAREDILLFKEDVYKYKNCGAVIESMNSAADIATYVKFSYEDGAVYINDDLCADDAIKSETGTLDDNIRTSIEIVFRNFGALSAESLGKCLSPIVNIEGISDDNGKIDLSKIRLLDKESFSSEITETKLIDFLLSL